MDRAVCDIPVITCSWLQEANVSALVGEITGHLHKPELLFEDFEAALREAGVELAADVIPAKAGIQQPGSRFPPSWE